MINNPITGKEALSYDATMHLFAIHFNDIDRAIDAAKDKPEILKELQEFKKLNQKYYDDCKNYFDENKPTIIEL